MAQTISLTIDADRVATLTIDLKDKPVNTMTRQVWTELDGALAEVEKAGPAGVIIASAKPKIFVAGADLYEIRAMSDDELRSYLVKGQRIYKRLEDLRMPTVAVINGDALGGGLELALACKMRIAVDELSIQIGLPETRIGLIPGWGGTVRLPRLIGPANALPMLLSGKPVNGVDALKLGLVDRVVTRDELMVIARELLKAPIKRPPPLAIAREEVDTLLNSARDEQIKRFSDHYPATLRLIEVVRDTYSKSVESGFAGEVQGLIDMRNTEAGKNLLRIFFMRSTAKKAAIEQAAGTPQEIRSVAVIGGGTMGSGIVHALIKSGIPATLIEANEELMEKGRARVQKLVDDDLRGGRMTESAAKDAASRLCTAIDLASIRDADLVIEAIVEQLPAKIELFKKLDEIVRENAILASNTSSLSITEIAQATANPARVVGIHFFNPVPRMPLVEVIRAKQSSSDALATAVAMANKLGKTPVLCMDSPGFIVNRVLFPQLHEACKMCDEGYDIVAIDKAIKQWGMPMGPFELMDEIGLDVTLFILQAFQVSIGQRLAPAPALIETVKQGNLGKKSGRGFYVYSKEKGVAPQPNPAVLSLFENSSKPISSPQEVQNRILQPMAEEARLLLAEGVVENAESIDVATIMGLGFANFRGGLARWMSQSI